ncbi:MAG: hypothetical protein WC441_00215 [Patescibacteria group bacterium]
MSKKSLFGLGLIFALVLLPSLSFAAPATPTLVSPSNNAKNYNHTVTTLYWSKIPGAARYELQIRKDNNGFTDSDSVTDANGWLNTNNYINPGQVTTANIPFLTGGLEPNKTYFWHVRACDATDCGNWSPAYKFSTAASPAKTTLSSPKFTSKTVNGVTTYSYPTIYKNKPQEFKWNMTNGSTYSVLRVYAATIPNFTSAPVCSITEKINIKLEGTAIGSGILSNTPAGNYCWTVTTYNNVGPGAESDPQFFILKNSIINPENIFAQTGFSSAVFYWTNNGGTNPTIAVSTKESFPNDVNSTSEDIVGASNFAWLSSGSYVYDFIKTHPNVNLFWKVKTADSGWSKARAFKSNFLKDPVISWPKGQTITATSSVFKWAASPGAKFYKMTVSDANGVVKTVYSTNSTYKIPSGWNLSAGAYTWKLTAINDFGESGEVTGGSFTAQ